MNHFTAISRARLFRGALASIAFAGLAQFGHAQASPVSVQTAEIEALLVAVHDVTSYNGDEQTAIDHLAAWEQCWAPDATLSVNGGAPFVGRDAIITFFAGSSLFNANLVGLTPSFRSKIATHGDTAEVYLECIFLKPDLTVAAQRSLSGTVKKIGGKWLFWKMANNAAQPLFP